MDFESLKDKIDALAQLAAVPNSRMPVVPTDVIGIIGALHMIAENMGRPIREHG